MCVSSVKNRPRKRHLGLLSFARRSHAVIYNASARLLDASERTRRSPNKCQTNTTGRIISRKLRHNIHRFHVYAYLIRPVYPDDPRTDRTVSRVLETYECAAFRVQSTSGPDLAISEIPQFSCNGSVGEVDEFSDFYEC